MITIEQLKRAKQVLDSAPVVEPRIAFVSECLVKGYCQKQGIPYELDEHGSMMICDTRIYVMERYKQPPGDDRIIECLTSRS